MMMTQSQTLLQGAPLALGGVQGEIEVKQQNLPRSTISFVRWLVKHPIAPQDVTMDARQVAVETAKLLPPAQRLRARSLLKLFENAVEAIPTVEPHPTIQMRLFVTSSPMTLDRLPQPNEPAVIATLNSVNGLSRLHVLPAFANDDLPDFKSMEIPAGIIALFQPVPQIFNQFTDNRAVNFEAGNVYAPDRTNRDTIESQNAPLPAKVITLPPGMAYMPLTPSPHQAYSLFHEDTIHRSETLRTIEGVVVGEWIGREVDQRNLPHNQHKLGVPLYAAPLAYAVMHYPETAHLPIMRYAKTPVDDAEQARRQAMHAGTVTSPDEESRLSPFMHEYPAVGAGSVLLAASPWEPFAHPSPAEPEIAEMQEETILERGLPPEQKYEVAESTLPLIAAIEAASHEAAQAYAQPTAYPQSSYSESQYSGAPTYAVARYPDGVVYPYQRENEDSESVAAYPAVDTGTYPTTSSGQVEEIERLAASTEISQPSASESSAVHIETPVAREGETSEPLQHPSISNSDQPTVNWDARREELAEGVDNNQPQANTGDIQEQIDRAKEQFEQEPQEEGPRSPEREMEERGEKMEETRGDRSDIQTQQNSEFPSSHDRFDEDGIRQPRERMASEEKHDDDTHGVETLLHGHEMFMPTEGHAALARAMSSTPGLLPIAAATAHASPQVDRDRSLQAPVAPAVRATRRAAPRTSLAKKGRGLKEPRTKAIVSPAPSPTPDNLDKLTPGI